MLSAQDIMSTNLYTVTPDTDIIEAAQMLMKHHINGLPVLDTDGMLVGILCQSDLIAQQKKMPLPSLFTLLDGFIALTSTKQIDKEVRKITAIKVADAMSPNPVTVKVDTRLETIAGLMVDNGFHTLPVVDATERLVGVIGKEDVLKTILSGKS